MGDRRGSSSQIAPTFSFLPRNLGARFLQGGAFCNNPSMKTSKPLLVLWFIFLHHVIICICIACFPQNLITLLHTWLVPSSNKIANITFSSVEFNVWVGIIFPKWFKTILILNPILPKLLNMPSIHLNCFNAEIIKIMQIFKLHLLCTWAIA